MILEMILCHQIPVSAVPDVHGTHLPAAVCDIIGFQYEGACDSIGI